MAQRFSAEILTTWAQTRVFDYLADFSNLPDWHPVVRESTLTTLDPYLRNARHRIVATIAGVSVAAEVVTAEIERPSLIVATAENAAARTIDRFDLRGTPDGAVSVAYRTELKLKAPLRMIGPLMVPALTSAWGQAVAELERMLSDSGAWTPV